MAKVHNVVLPRDLSERLVKVLDQIPDSVLVDMGKLLPGGFTRAPLVKTRLAEMLWSDNPVPPWLLPFLREHLPGTQVMRGLSIEALKELLDTFVLLKGRDSTALPLLIDAREEARQLGAEVLSRKPHRPLKADHAKATRSLCEFIDYRLMCVADLKITPEGDAVPKLPEMPLPEGMDLKMIAELFEVMPARMEKQLATIEQLERNLKEQAERHKERLKKAVQQQVDENRKVRAARDEARQSLVRITAENESLKQQLEGLNATIQAEVERRVAEQTSALTRKWLVAPMEEERVLKKLEASDLFTQAQQALETQARQDKVAGTRLELERKLEQLRRLHVQLSTAAQNAVHPLPVVRTVLGSLEAELRHVESLVNHHKATDPLTEKLLVAINAAETWNEAQLQSQLLQQIIDADLVPKSERRRLYDSLQRKLSLLAETVSPSASDLSDHGWSLRQTVYRDTPSLLLLDGYNILFGLEDIFRPFYDKEGRPGRKARERLIQLTHKLVEGRHNLRVRIHFDGSQHENITLHRQIQVEYSGGKGEHRADQRIAEQVAWRRPEEVDQTWYVVTEDRAVRRQAVSNGADMCR